ncbi:hypothetical protein FDG2_0115 [Candidatus Protofrankia californiensis]|uniref:Uncharacterized protein n=1 Tax=Candidatus Protofrankia californiensis TaxID=1839754 RepID=A0A1C3NSX0_9ACTN|nr:hypothetical protein FDG2_0115 [Candidatus Protofrankia californiensis]
MVAHQLAVAAPPRSRAERAQARIDRSARRRVDRARWIAARCAVVELAADGTARLVYAPGLYIPRRDRLVPATVAGLPVADGWDAALADLLHADPDPDVPGHPDRQVDPIPGADLHPSSGVAVLDAPLPVDPTPAPGPITPIESTPRIRTAKQIRAAARRLARRHGRPVSAEFLRRELKIAPAAARSLRDELNAELYGGTS